MISENPLSIEYSPLFKKYLKQIPAAIKTAFLETRELFDENPNDPVLRNHPLRGKYAGFRSIDVTDDYRALFKIRETKKEAIVIFHFLGTHEDLYGEN